MAKSKNKLEAQSHVNSRRAEFRKVFVLQFNTWNPGVQKCDFMWTESSKSREALLGRKEAQHLDSSLDQLKSSCYMDI